jgi:hypothetical protein
MRSRHVSNAVRAVCHSTVPSVSPVSECQLTSPTRGAVAAPCPRPSSAMAYMCVCPAPWAAAPAPTRALTRPCLCLLTAAASRRLSCSRRAQTRARARRSWSATSTRARWLRTLCARPWCVGLSVCAVSTRSLPAAADWLTASLLAQGPLGMDKLIFDSKGTTISNDGATILKVGWRPGGRPSALPRRSAPQPPRGAHPAATPSPPQLLDIVHPAAKTMVDIAKSQDAEVRTSVCS